MPFCFIASEELNESYVASQSFQDKQKQAGYKTQSNHFTLPHLDDYQNRTGLVYIIREVHHQTRLQ